MSRRTHAVLHQVQGNVLLADTNTGYTVLSAKPGRKYTIVGGYFKAIGGNYAAATSLDVKDTAGTPIVAVAVAVAQLTQNTQTQFKQGATGVTWTTRGPLTVSKGVMIQKTGSTATTATSVDYQIFYTVS